MYNTDVKHCQTSELENDLPTPFKLNCELEKSALTELFASPTLAPFGGFEVPSFFVISTDIDKTAWFIL